MTLGTVPVSGDARFFARTGPHRLDVVAQAAGGSLMPEPTAEQAAMLLHGIGPLQTAGAGQVSFLDNRKYIAALAASAASVVIMHPAMAEHMPPGCIAIVTREPYLGWARVAALFHPLPPPVPGIHPSALVDASASIDPSAEIGPFVVIGPMVEIGPRCRVGSGADIGQGVRIGADCRVGPHVSISHALIGDRVRLFPGVRIGQEGFGLATTMTPTGPVHFGIPQLGRVVIEDDVDVGANSCIDRGSAQDTVIGAGSRIDNQVQIGHNVKLGRGCVIVAQVGISGSTVFEDFVVAAGQAGFAGHVRVGRGARIGGQAGVMSDIPAGQEVTGSPAQPARSFFRQVATLRRLAGLRGKSNIAGSDAASSGSAQGTVSD
jgi:UDP-3-O-[3-hydroxymyristoyl] glucosamine N-acyltransferase